MCQSVRTLLLHAERVGEHVQAQAALFLFLAVALGAMHFQNRLNVLGEIHLRLRQRHRNLGLENRPGIGFRHRSPALWPCLALSLHYGSFSIVWSIASAPESPPSLGHQASRQRCGTLWREMNG